VIGGDGRGAAVAAVGVAVAVIASLTAGHFAPIFYFELAEATTLEFERELIELSNGSAGLEHHERPDHADKLQVLRTEVSQLGFRAIESVLNALGLALAMAITAVLLARLDPWLLLLPIAAVPPLLLGRRAEALVAASREAAAQPIRRARQDAGQDRSTSIASATAAVSITSIVVPPTPCRYRLLSGIASTR